MIFQICLAVLVLAAVAIAAPFNAVGPFYNGNIAKVPYFAIAEVRTEFYISYGDLC